MTCRPTSIGINMFIEFILFLWFYCKWVWLLNFASENQKSPPLKNPESAAAAEREGASVVLSYSYFLRSLQQPTPSLLAGVPSA